MLINNKQTMNSHYWCFIIPQLDNCMLCMVKSYPIGHTKMEKNSLAEKIILTMSTGQAQFLPLFHIWKITLTLYLFSYSN